MVYSGVCVMLQPKWFINLCISGWMLSEIQVSYLGILSLKALD